MTANALNGQVGHVARLVGGAVGGVVAATGGLGAVVVVDTASFLLAALLVQLIRTPTKPPREVDADAATGAAAAVRRAAVEWREGASTVRRSRVLKVLLAFSLITAVGEGIMGTLFTPYVKDVLEGNAATLGTVSSAQADRRDPRRLRRRGRRPTLVVAGAVRLGRGRVRPRSTWRSSSTRSRTSPRGRPCSAWRWSASPAR